MAATLCTCHWRSKHTLGRDRRHPNLLDLGQQAGEWAYRDHYDHPTPVDGESTLPCLLESLAALGGPEFSVLVLTAATYPELEKAAADQVASLIAPFRARYPIAQAIEAEAAFIRQRHAGLADYVQMRGYAGVRNLQLLLPHVLGAEVVVALDDD